MKMAKASEADIECALALSRIIEDIERGDCPRAACEDEESEAIEWLDPDDASQMHRLIDAIKSTARQGSIFRVTFGMGVVCDPRNELLNPDADTLEVHPKYQKQADDLTRLNGESKVMLDLMELSLGVMETIVPDDCDSADELDKLISAFHAVLSERRTS